MIAPATLFLFPHQDDEFGVFPLLDRNQAAGRRSLCVFLTDGAGNGADPARRDRESAAVLARSGVGAADVVVLGAGDRPKDGGLVDRLDVTLDRLVAALDRTEVAETFVPAWEGGHPDHDAAVLLAHALARVRPIGPIRQFPLYNAYRAGALPFRLFASISENGPVERLPVPLRATPEHLARCLVYRSQRKTFAALLPALAWQHAVKRGQTLQALDPDRLTARPHEGALLYERRRWLTFDDFKRRAAAFVSRALS